jgi:multidrug resistance protein, MATE family
MNFVVVGHLGDSSMISGAGLGIITGNVACFSIAIGLAGGIDTLSSQAFGNKKNYLGNVFYQRAQIILTVLFIPQAIILYNAESILLFIGQPESSSMYAGQYLRICFLGIWAY